MYVECMCVCMSFVLVFACMCVSGSGMRACTQAHMSCTYAHTHTLVCLLCRYAGVHKHTQTRQLPTSVKTNRVASQHARFGSACPSSICNLDDRKPHAARRKMTCWATMNFAVIWPIKLVSGPLTLQGNSRLYFARKNKRGTPFCNFHGAAKTRH